MILLTSWPDVLPPGFEDLTEDQQAAIVGSIEISAKRTHSAVTGQHKII